MEEAERRREIMAKPIHDGDAVKSLRRQMMILSETQKYNLRLFGITYQKEQRLERRKEDYRSNMLAE